MTRIQEEEAIFDAATLADLLVRHGELKSAVYGHDHQPDPVLVRLYEANHRSVDWAFRAMPVEVARKILEFWKSL